MPWRLQLYDTLVHIPLLSEIQYFMNTEVAETAFKGIKEKFLSFIFAGQESVFVAYVLIL